MTSAIDNEIRISTLSTDKPTGYIHIGEGFTISYYKKLPNRFHRFMQQIILGFKWEIVGKENE